MWRVGTIADVLGSFQLLPASRSSEVLGSADFSIASQLHCGVDRVPTVRNFT